MAYPDDAGAILVSLQMRDPQGGPPTHLALGALVGREHAVFDLPAGVVVPSGMEWEVLIAPTAARELDVVERIRPLQVLIRSLADSPGARVALTPLAQASRYGAEPPRLTPDELRQALTFRGEIWGALADLGLVPEPRRDVDPTAALTRLEEIEKTQRDGLVSELPGRDPDEIARCPVSNVSLCGYGGFLDPRA